MSNNIKFTHLSSKRWTIRPVVPINISQPNEISRQLSLNRYFPYVLATETPVSKMCFVICHFVHIIALDYYAKKILRSESFMACSQSWMTSSRVGTMMRAKGVDRFDLNSPAVFLFITLSIVGRRKAVCKRKYYHELSVIKAIIPALLPLPVSAWPFRSIPNTTHWIGKS